MSVCECACLPPRLLITTHVTEASFEIQPAVNIANGRGHSNEVHRALLSKKTKVRQY